MFSFPGAFCVRACSAICSCCSDLASRVSTWLLSLAFIAIVCRKAYAPSWNWIFIPFYALMIVSKASFENNPRNLIRWMKQLAFYLKFWTSRAAWLCLIIPALWENVGNNFAIYLRLTRVQLPDHAKGRCLFCVHAETISPLEFKARRLPGFAITRRRLC